MIRPFTITPVLNGYIVEIGCQRLVFTSREELVRDINLYLEHPDGVEGNFLKFSLNAQHLQPLTTEGEPPRSPVYGNIEPQPISTPRGATRGQDEGCNAAPQQSGY